MTSINSLDPSQKDVLESLLSEKSGEGADFSVVYGPPGTGKSHMIISLLFELAIRKKKVLFVSQNTEALDVIKRMYEKLEDEFQFGPNEVSLLDFALMLYRPEQRRLKYIKQQSSRLLRKMTSPVFGISSDMDTEKAPYALTYTNNFDSEMKLDGRKLGVDEMVRYYLHNVKHDNMLGTPIKGLGSIDTRGILNYLEEFEGKFDNFAFNIHPVGVLSYIAKSASVNTDLNTIQNYAMQISRALRVIPDDVKTKLSALENIYIIDFLGLVERSIEINQYVDIGKLQHNDVDGEEFVKTVHRAVKLYRSVESDSTIVLPDDVSQEYLLGPVKGTALVGPNSLGELETKANKILEAYTGLKKYGMDMKANFNKAISVALRESGFNFRQLIREYPGLTRMGERELKELCEASIDWSGRSTWYQAFHDPAKILMDLQTDLDYKALDKLHSEYADEIMNASAVLEETSVTLGELNTLLSNNNEKNLIVSPLAKVPEKDYHTVLQLLLIIRESCSFLEGYGAMKLNEIADIAKATIQDAELLSQIISENEEKLEEMNLTEVVDAVNNAIENKKKLKTVETDLARIAPYFVNSSDNLAATIDTMDGLINELTSDGELTNIMKQIKNVGVTKYDKNSFQKIVEIITDSLKSGIFSDDFYYIRQNGNLEGWSSLVDSLLAYQDFEQLENYLQQHGMIAQVKQMVGEDNAENIDEYLASDSITYDDFCERITVDLIRAERQGLSMAERTTMQDDYFDRFGTSMTKLRKKYYVDGIKELFRDTALKASEIASVKNWLPGLSVMDQIRRNTKSILKVYPIIIATPKDVSRYIKAEKDLFDYVVFDEASQLLPGQALPSIYRAKRAVVIGDPHQMPPVASTLLTANTNAMDGMDGDGDSIQNERSILDIAIALANRRKYHLMVHYRSKYNILFEPSRQAIYEADGVSSIVEARSPVDPPITIRDNLGSEDVENFPIIIEHIIEGHKHNPSDRFCLLFTTMTMQNEFQKYISENEYNDGCALILRLEDTEKLIVTTVTNCQGIEGEKSILYFQHYEKPGSMWFFRANAGAYKRLNVSITRQRESLDILMAEPKSKWIEACQNCLERTAVADVELSAKLMLDLLLNAGQQVDVHYLDAMYGGNIDKVRSPLTREIYDRLCDRYSDRIGKDMMIWCGVGYEMLLMGDLLDVDRKTNIGYKIDIAIYSIPQKKFILGIEMDGSVYSPGTEKQFIDEQRREVLTKLKEWDIYRVWSSNWLKNPDAEYRGLIEIIDSKA